MTTPYDSILLCLLLFSAVFNVLMLLGDSAPVLRLLLSTPDSLSPVVGEGGRMTPILVVTEPWRLTTTCLLIIILLVHLFAIALAGATTEIKVRYDLATLSSLLPEVIIMHLDLLLSLILICSSEAALTNLPLLRTPWSNFKIHLCKLSKFLMLNK